MLQAEKLPCHRECNEDFCMYTVKLLRSFICTEQRGGSVVVLFKDHSGQWKDSLKFQRLLYKRKRQMPSANYD